MSVSTKDIDVEDIPAVKDAWYNFILKPQIQNFIICIIILNTITLGLETFPYISKNFGQLLAIFDKFALTVYTIELSLKLLALRFAFFKSGWNLFDLAIVGIAYIPAVGPLAALRSFRILRALRLVTSIPKLRLIVRSLLASLPSIGWISLLLLLIFYVFAIISIKLFGSEFPEWFGTLGEAYYTLFQLLTLESWSAGIVRPVMEKFPLAWLFFVPFILITSFVVMNVFIAVVVDSMSQMKSEEQSQVAAEMMSQKNITPAAQLTVEIENMRAQLARLEALSVEMQNESKTHI